MSLQSLERKIQKELVQVTKNKNARWFCWYTDEESVTMQLKQEGDKKIFLPVVGVWVGYYIKGDDK